MIDEGKLFSRKQIQRIWFNNMKPESSKRKCQETLQKLVAEKRIKRYQKDYFNPAYYYTQTKPTNLNHIHQINNVYCAFLEQKKPWQSIEWKWSYSLLNGTVFADAYINFYSLPDKKGRKSIFLECETDPRKRFDKHTQYQKIYDSNWHKPPFPEWAVIDESSKKAIFPTILLVTDHPIDFQSDLNFIIASPDQVQSDVYSLLK